MLIDSMVQDKSLKINRDNEENQKDLWTLVDHLTRVFAIPQVDTILLTSGSEDVRYFKTTKGGKERTVFTIPIPVAFFLSNEELECYLYQKLHQVLARIEMADNFQATLLYQKYVEIDQKVNRTFGARLNLQATIKAFNLHQLWCLFTADNEFYRFLVSSPSQGIHAFFSNAKPFLMDLKYKSLIVESLKQADENLVFLVPIQDRLETSELSVNDIVNAVMKSPYRNQFFNLENPILHELMSELFNRHWKRLESEQVH